MRVTEHSQGTHDWTGAGKVQSSLWSNAAVCVVAVEPVSFTHLHASLIILLVIRLPTNLASFLEGAFNQMKPASWTFQQISSKHWFPLTPHTCHKCSPLLSPWISQQWAEGRKWQWGKLAPVDIGSSGPSTRGKQEEKQKEVTAAPVAAACVSRVSKG